MNLTFSFLWQYLAKLFLEWEIVWTKVVENIKTHILYSVTFFRKSRSLWDNAEKVCGAIEARDNMAPARSMLQSQDTRSQAHACGRITPTHTHTVARTHRNMQYLFLFHGNNGFMIAPQCYVIRTLPVLFLSLLVTMSQLFWDPSWTVGMIRLNRRVKRGRTHLKDTFERFPWNYSWI